MARGLSVVGDRWVLLILRDCFRGLRRFDDFQRSLGITRHVLADRLKSLESNGVLERRQYQDAPPRHEYRLTERGHALYPVIVALVRWADTHRPHPDAGTFTYRDRDSGDRLDPVLVDRATGRPITARGVVAGHEPG